MSVHRTDSSDSLAIDEFVVPGLVVTNRAACGEIAPPAQRVAPGRWVCSACAVEEDGAATGTIKRLKDGLLRVSLEIQMHDEA